MGAMRIKTGVRALTVAALLVAGGAISAGVANADAPDLPTVTRFINVNTGECLTAHAQGNYVGMAPCDGRSAQTWQVWGSGYVQDVGDLNCMQRIPNSSSIDTIACGWSVYDLSEDWLNLDNGSPSAVVNNYTGGSCLTQVGQNALALGCIDGSYLSWYH